MYMQATHHQQVLWSWEKRQALHYNQPKRGFRSPIRQTCKKTLQHAL